MNDRSPGDIEVVFALGLVVIGASRRGSEEAIAARTVLRTQLAPAWPDSAATG